MSAPIEADVHQVSKKELSRPHNLLYGLNESPRFIYYKTSVQSED